MRLRTARLATAFLSLTVMIAAGTANAAEPTAKSGDALVKDLALLFVQSADSGTYDGTRLSLAGVGSTLFFADRPARVSGHLDTAKFLGAWGADAGSDSFAADPPNATLSVLAGDAPVNVVVELSDPKQQGTTVSYAVKVLDGKLPNEFGTASLFIDHHSSTGGYIAAGLGGAVLGGALMKASEPKEKVVVEEPAPPPPGYYGPGYYYTAAPPPCNCTVK
jgi:hypothetical protein